MTELQEGFPTQRCGLKINTILYTRMPKSCGNAIVTGFDAVTEIATYVTDLGDTRSDHLVSLTQNFCLGDVCETHKHAVKKPCMRVYSGIALDWIRQGKRVIYCHETFVSTDESSRQKADEYFIITPDTACSKPWAVYLRKPETAGE